MDNLWVLAAALLVGGVVALPLVLAGRSCDKAIHLYYRDFHLTYCQGHACEHWSHACQCRRCQAEPFECQD